MHHNKHYKLITTNKSWINLLRVQSPCSAMVFLFMSNMIILLLSVCIYIHLSIYLSIYINIRWVFMKLISITIPTLGECINIHGLGTTNLEKQNHLFKNYKHYKYIISIRIKFIKKIINLIYILFLQKMFDF